MALFSSANCSPILFISSTFVFNCSFIESCRALTCALESLRLFAKVEEFCTSAIFCAASSGFEAKSFHDAK